MSHKLLSPNFRKQIDFNKYKGDRTMGRPITLFTGQWADLPLEELAKMASGWGYDGLELACWGDHFEVDRAVNEADYCDKKKKLLAKYGLEVYAISNHLAGQLVCDSNDFRSEGFAPIDTHGNSEKMRLWAIEQMKNTARAAQKLGVEVVNGFTGSPIWHMLYLFPPVDQGVIENGYRIFAELWNPILDVFDECGVKFALEVHPTEIAYDIPTAEATLEALEYRENFGFNFDPSHLFWQGICPVKFIEQFADCIFHTHIKDCSVYSDGYRGILGSHLPFGDRRRGWDFRSPGRGQINFEEIIRVLNEIGYEGPLSVEWEDAGMKREAGAKEAVDFVKKLDFEPSEIAFDDAFTDHDHNCDCECEGHNHK